MNPDSPAQLLRSGLAHWPTTGQDILPGQIDQLLAYLDLLQRWSRAYNLTAIRDPAAMVTHHLLDSLAILPWVPAGPLLDAGTGAGLPGVPLAIARPTMQVTLLDSAGKKIRFLNQVRRELRLGNIEPVQARLETYRPQTRFDAIVSRAFSRLAAFAEAVREWAGDARLLAMKGRHPAAELQELPGWVKVRAVERLAVPGLQEERHLVIMSVNP